MRFTELCRNRFSVRNYRPDPIPENILTDILECARLAPSAVNKQPWKIFVCQSEDIRKQIQTAYTRDWFRQAPVYLVLCQDIKESWTRQYDQKDHGMIDVAILAEHICLAACDMGIGSCWVCNFDAEKVCQTLQLQPTIVPHVIIPLGYTEEKIENYPKKRKAITEICIWK